MGAKAIHGRKFLYFTVLTVNLLALTAGISLTWTSPVLPQLTEHEFLENNPFGETISSEEGSWIGSLLALGASFGPLIAGYLADKFGRKITLLALAVPYILSFLTLAFARHVALYYVMRFIAGLSLGSTFTIVPMFIAEISEDSNRGTMSTILNVLVTGGTLFSYIVGAYVSITWFCIICAAIPTLFLVIFFIFIPESPYYLAKRNSLLSAENSLGKLRSCEEYELKSELATIRNTINNETPATFLDIFKKKGTIKAFLISSALMTFQQFSGINIILFYSQIIFDASGSKLSPEICAIIIGVTQVAASFVSPIFVDKLGRKILFLISAIGMLIFEVTIGVYFYLYEHGTDVSTLSVLPVICLVGYILTYNTGFGPLPWVVMAELFPGNVKSAASASIGSYCWFIGFLLTKFFSLATDHIGMGGSFWFFSAFNIAAIIFVITYVPETKGKSLQEIVDFLNS